MARLLDGYAHCDHHHATASSEHSCCTGRGEKLQVLHPETGHQAHFVPQAVKHRLGSDVVSPHTAPLGGIAAVRGPRPRRCSLDERPGTHQHSSNSDSIRQASSIKQRLRQRRFSIAIGENIPLRTIREGQLEDVALGWDQYHGAGQQEDMISNNSQHPAFPGNNSNSSSSGDSIQTLMPTDLQTHYASEQLDVRASSFYSSTASPVSTTSRPSYQQQHSFDRRPPCSPEHYTAARHQNSWASHAAAQHTAAAEPGLDQAGVLALLQHMAAQTGQQEQPQRHQRRQSHPPQVLRVHHEGDNTLTGLSQEQIWHQLQHQRREQQEQQEQQQQLQHTPHQRQTLAQQQWQHQQQSQALAAQQQQQLDADDDNDFEFWAHQQQQLEEDGWGQLQQMLQELSYTRPGSSTSRPQGRQHSRQLLAQQSQALSALQEIESELQQLLSMHERLAAAQAIAAPGSRADAVCAHALMRHQAVLQQALATRQEISAAVCEAAAALDGFRRACGAAGGMQLGQSADAPLIDAQSHFEGHYRGYVEEEPLYPADGDAESTPCTLLQHFGHYAII